MSFVFGYHHRSTVALQLGTAECTLRPSLLTVFPLVTFTLWRSSVSVFGYRFQFLGIGRGNGTEFNIFTT